MPAERPPKENLCESGDVGGYARLWYVDDFRGVAGLS